MTHDQVILWASDAGLVLSYLLLGRKWFKSGWTISAVSSLGFVIGGVWIHQPAIWTVRILFMLIALCNLYLEIFIHKHKIGMLQGPQDDV